MKGYSIHFGVDNLDKAHYGSNYTPLTAAVKDANEMYKLAFSLGYQTLPPFGDKSASVGNLIRSLDQISDKVEPKDTLLITFSGHGANKRRVQSICMYDRLLGEKELLQLIEDRFKTKDIVVVLVLDSCYSGGILDRRYAFAKSAKQEDYLGRFLPDSIVDLIDHDHYNDDWTKLGKKELFEFSTQILLLAACKENRKSWEKIGVQGVFTESLLKVWNNNTFNGSYQEFATDVFKLISSYSRHPPNQQAPQLRATIDDLKKLNPFKFTNH